MMAWGVIGFIILLMIYTGRELEAHMVQKRWPHAIVHGVILLALTGGCVALVVRAVRDW